ncbi:MAG: DUF493 domain-containing protein [Kiritimatiellae bacterium]|nr:DUF493 domain-containing protein [Kiritimatiellia bacterium]
MTEEKIKKMCGVELEFPLVCHVKVITEKRDDIHGLIEDVLGNLKVVAEVSLGNSSAEGKYTTYNFSFTADSKEIMEKVDQAIRAVDGVKMVL